MQLHPQPPHMVLHHSSWHGAPYLPFLTTDAHYPHTSCQVQLCHAEISASHISRSRIDRNSCGTYPRQPGILLQTGLRIHRCVHRSSASSGRASSQTIDLTSHSDSTSHTRQVGWEDRDRSVPLTRRSYDGMGSSSV